MRILAALGVVASGSPAQAGGAWRETSTVCRLQRSLEEITAVGIDPAILLRAYPSGGEAMAWRVRELATSGPLGLAGVGRAIPRANAAQKASIGEGLARGAIACDAREGVVTAGILDLVRAAGDLDVTSVFTRRLAGETDLADASRLVDAQPARSTLVPLSGGIGGAGVYFRPSLDRPLPLDGAGP
jgi:hypothetical protein